MSTTTSSAGAASSTPTNGSTFTQRMQELQKISDQHSFVTQQVSVQISANNQAAQTAQEIK